MNQKKNSNSPYGRDCLPTQGAQHQAVIPKPLIIDESNKYVLGAYFSLGLTNFFKTVMLVFTRVGIQITNPKTEQLVFNEEKIGEVLHTLYRCSLTPLPAFEPREKNWVSKFNLNTNQQALLKKLLFRHFPILGPIMADRGAYNVNKHKKSNVVDSYSINYGVTLSECLSALSYLGQALVDCRNAHVHYDPINTAEKVLEQRKAQDKIVHYLNKALVASRRIDKKRNKIETEKMEFLTGYAREDKAGKDENLQKYLLKNKFYPKYVQRVKRDENGKVLYVQETDRDGNLKFNEDGAPMYRQLKDRFGNLLTNQDGTPKYETQKYMEERNDFFCRIGQDVKLLDADKVTQEKKYKELTGFGLVYFCAIFLTKNQTRQLLSDIKLFENSPYPEELNDIIRDMMSIYRIRSLRGRKLEGSDSLITLSLDILNELRKCPKELYDVLDQEGQQFFEDKVVNQNDHTAEVVKRFRSADRFPYLVLRYIDETQVLKKMRFQVRLGRFRFHFRDKTCFNEEKEVRGYQKEINGYGRLQEIELKRKEEYGKSFQSVETRLVKLEHENLELNLTQLGKDSVDSKPYITDDRAQYAFNNDRIGLYWVDQYNEKQNKEFIAVGDYIPQLIITEDGKASIDMPAPKVMLSVHELPAMMFYHHLCKRLKLSKSIEDVIQEKYFGIRHFFQDVSEGNFRPVTRRNELITKLKNYNLSISDIPEKLLHYLLSKKVEDATVRRKRLVQEVLKEHLKKTIERKKHFQTDRGKVGNKDNNYGKDSYGDVRHGKLAAYLSKSILKWQPTANEGKDKMTGMNFSKLQAELALFDSQEKFNTIKEILSKAKLIGDSSIAHPFLGKVIGRRIRNIEEFYSLYLDEEIRYLLDAFGLTNKKDLDLDFDKLQLKQDIPVPFVKGKARWEPRTPDYCKRLAKRYLIDEKTDKQTSILLPDRLFTDLILNLLKEHFTDNQELQACLKSDELNKNASYLITSYFEHQTPDGEQDSSQSFYTSSNGTDENGEPIPGRFARYYELFSILNNVKNRNQLVPVAMTVEGINKRFTSLAADADGRLMEFIDNKGVTSYKKQIHYDIEKYVRELKRRENYKSLQEAKAAKKAKLIRLIREVKNNERAIRRYKVQDMILFLMAKSLLEDKVRTAEEGQKVLFQLKSVCSKKFLNQTLDIQFPVLVEDKTVYIRQQNMSIKNYGELYQLLNDDRLLSLLKKLVAADQQIGDGERSIEYNSLMGELTSYDIHRSSIFKAIHELEKLIAKNKDFSYLYDMDDPKAHIEDDLERDPKLNNFNSLIKLLETADLSSLNKDESELIIAIRNAFSHNHYNLDISSLNIKKTRLLHPKTEDEALVAHLTTIATLIKDRMKELQEKVNNYYKS